MSFGRPVEPPDVGAFHAGDNNHHGSLPQLLLRGEQTVDSGDTNIDQFIKVDQENQTAYLDLPNGGYWWNWYGSEFEAHAWYLKLLAATKPQSKQARGLVKYLINNRKHATYWNSTRDTAYCIEAIADYMELDGFEFDFAYNGAAGLNLALDGNYDLILTDINMPKMDGLEMVEKIGNTSVPIIITTAYSDIDYFLKAIELKISKFVIKLGSNNSLRYSQ